MTESITGNGGAPPRVDPTKLTTEAVNIAKEDLRREMSAIRELAETNLHSLRTEVMSEIRRIDDVSVQKFNGIKQQFDERDERVNQTALSGRISLDAALAAAKEAVGEQNKSNTLSIDVASRGTTKQIDALQELFTTSIRSVEDKIADHQRRLDSGEGSTRGQNIEKTEQRSMRRESGDSIGRYIAGATGFIGVVTIVITLIASHHL